MSGARVPGGSVRPSAPLSATGSMRPPPPPRLPKISSPTIEVDPESADSRPPSIPSAAGSQATRAVEAETMPLTPAIILPGHVLAQRYEVENTLGEGGMGIVYGCRDRTSGERVAVKRVIPPDGKLAGEYITWFYKEARALASLDHPGIVHARDFGQLADGSPYLAMELVKGVSLHDLTVAKLSFPILWSLVDQILSALAHAHARRVIHGDLKPSNVIVEERSGRAPRVHMLDFGLAWLKEDPHDERLDGAKAMEFTPHAGAGTPGYMAPEQIQHEMHHVAGATDLYSLACIMYKLLSGKAPFSGDPKELLKLHAYTQAPELELAIEAPKGVAGFVMRLLNKRPWDRFEFAAEARRAWAEFDPGPDQPESVWRFPKLPHKKTHAPSSRKPSSNPEASVVGLATDRGPGLLGIRPSPLVGREDIRGVLKNVASDVIAGRGAPHRLVILLGPAGVGKSRVAEWLTEYVHEEGSMMPLTARYRPMRSSLDGMLGAVTQALNFERVDRDTIERSLMARWNVRKEDRNLRAWVAGAAEWLRPTPPGEEAAIGPSGVRFTLDTLDIRRQVVRFTLRKIANGRPLLFFLDDLHHAAGPTFDGLLRIHATEPDIQIFMLATVRAEDVQLGTPAAERLRQLREAMDGDVIEVNPMDREMTMELLRASLPLDDDAVQEATRRSRGFPLFALQQLHAWAHGGEMEYVDGHYRVPQRVLSVRPKTTEDLWDTRLHALNDRHQLAALAVATLGVDVRRSVVLALLTDLKLPAESAILAMQNAEILLPRGPDRYSWPHALLQEHLFRRLTDREDCEVIFKAAARALEEHPLANSRRMVRQRVVNLLYAREADTAAQTFFDFLQRSWYGAREPAASLADLDLLQGHLHGRMEALEKRWRAEAQSYLGQTEEAIRNLEDARVRFDKLGDQENLAHCLRLLGQLQSERGDSNEGLRLVAMAHQTFMREGNILGMAECEAAVGEIEYLQGNLDRVRSIARQGEEHFASVDQHLGRGQCLLLLSWVEHSSGATARARKLTEQARGEFERAGYRVGLAKTTVSLAHIEHRMFNYYSAQLGAEDALGMFESLRTLRGQAACERLLAMVTLDTDDLDAAEAHADRALDLHEEMGDPWGVVESRLLLAQVALARHEHGEARDILSRARDASVQEPEPKQHYLLTKAWMAMEAGDPEAALGHLDSAENVFEERYQVGDHTPHLLARLRRFKWPPLGLKRIDAWREIIHARAQRDDG